MYFVSLLENFNISCHLIKLNGLTTFYINLNATTFMTENPPLSAINECAIDCAV